MNGTGNNEDISAKSVPGWQPIDTAPKDGTTFIIGRDNSVAHPYSGPACWKSGRFRDPTDMWQRYWNNPTHWMPLPEPPK